MNKRAFGVNSRGENATLYTFENKNGMVMEVTDFGATLFSLLVPDGKGNLVDVVLGYDDPQGYEGPSGTFFGATVGRNANRIGQAKFVINGQEYQIDKNDNGKNNLHSGFDFQSFRVWQVKSIGDNTITFTIHSPDGDQGYPGVLDMDVTYTLTEENEIRIDYHGVPQADTIVNYTNHSYFNLNGHASGSIAKHMVWVDADHYTPADAESIPTGEIAPVEGTPMDFRVKKEVGRDIDQDFEALNFGKGYDHNWCLNNAGQFAKVAEMTADVTGITMEVYTDLPGVQIYSGNFLVEEPGKGGVVYKHRQGICFETQYYPDALNHATFPSSLCKAGQIYKTTTVYKFLLRTNLGGNEMSVPALVLNSEKKTIMDTGFAAIFGSQPERYFSAPGRTEISGNHTDHQRGCVLAGAVNLDTVAAVRLNGTNVIRIQSKGYPMCEVSLEELEPVASEINSTAALIRGVAARFAQFGCKVEGFDAYCESTVLPGSGLSSSAAYEVLIGTIINCLFFDQKLSAVEIAQVGQYAENVFFGKPCGLMDQMASSVGGMVYIDFEDPQDPVVQKIDFDLAAAGHALCIIDTGADHADLTDEYAAVTQELKDLCALLGEQQLRSIPIMDFYNQITTLRQQVGDRAVMRAIHVYDENQRVNLLCEALRKGDFQGFLSYITESGLSSWRLLQNVIPAGRTAKQEVAFALIIAEKLLNGRGACRVHGGGFAGTIQAFVPLDLLDEFKSGMESVLGEGSCYVLSIRPQGGVEMEVEA